MSIHNSPEINLARRVLIKHSLKPPFDVLELLEKYATVYFESIPIYGVDGIAVNIKVPGKTPLVIINTDSTTTRQQFTMAHELGHLLIPWHTGIKIDNPIDGSGYYSEYMYASIEGEANRFAGELLMPGDILNKIAIQHRSLANVQREVFKRLKVSPIAAAIQLCRTLSPGIIFCAVKNGKVDYFGRTEGTHGNMPRRDQPYGENWYAKSTHTVCNVGELTFHWWQPNEELIPTTSQDNREWREILDDMLSDLSTHDKDKYKKSISDIIGTVNSKLKRENTYEIESLFAACCQRFDHADHYRLTNDPLFTEFLSKRLKELIDRATS